MKCPNCAATIGLEDRFCPYCGARNPFAVKHQQDMERYEREYASVRADVTETSRRTASLTAPLIIAVILLLLNIGAAIFVHNSWDIGHNRISREMASHMDEYRADLDRFLEARDYGGYDGYYHANSLYLCDELDDIHPVERAASCYSTILSEILRYNGFSYNYTYDGSKESLEKAAEYIAAQVVTLYGIESDFGYDTQKYFTKPNKDAIEAIRRDTESLLKVWFSLTDDDIVDLPSLSKSGLKERLIRRAGS